MDVTDKDWHHLQSTIERSCARGTFTLKDGTRNPLFVRGHSIMGDPRALNIASGLLLAILMRWKVQAIAGESSGAYPLMGALLMLAHSHNYPLSAMYIRKEALSHGTGNRLDFDVPSGIVTAIVDDVSSSGMTMLRCREVLISRGASVIGFATIVDRERFAADTCQKIGMRFACIYKVTETKISSVR